MKQRKLNHQKSVSAIRSKLLQKRYLRKNNKGNVIESADQMWWRIANSVAKAEELYGAAGPAIDDQAKEFYAIMANGYFLPNSPTLMNAGCNNGMLSACFVLPVPDSIDGIFNTVKYTALIQKAGGGTGFSFDMLRPSGDTVSSTGGQTSGPISFWKVIAETTKAIQQGAHRRGANMGMMSLDHPDILKFVTAKNDLSAFSNFNITVKITDRFMEDMSTASDSPHVVKNPRTGKSYYIPKDIDLSRYELSDLIPSEKRVSSCYTRQDVWDLIVKNAHANGEPGICFIDEMNKFNPTPALGSIHVTNPCGEQPLLYYESCNLGSIDISKFVSSGEIDWQRLSETIETAVRFLDNVIDVNYYLIPEIKKITLGNRKIGLGLMGFADSLILMQIRYDSEQAIQLASRLSKFFQEESHRASEKLAWEKGCFPNWQDSAWDRLQIRPMRNATCTTIAPTGSISLIAGCSSSIEPVFSFAYERKILDGQKFIQLHPLIEKLGEQDGWITDSIRSALLEGVSAKDILGIPKEVSEFMVTAHEVPPEMHVRIQAAFQENIDNAVSKTVNLPATASIEEVDSIFKLAYRLNCKGITVYRDQSREGQVLKTVHKDGDVFDGKMQPRSRPSITSGRTTKYRMGCGTLFVTVNKDEKGPCEVFANLGKAGGCPSQSEATCRAVSAALRSGVAPSVMIDQLSGIRCLSTAVARKSNKEVDVLSCPDAISQALEESLGFSDANRYRSFVKKCPDCGQTLRFESGCDICKCGYSKCG